MKKLRVMSYRLLYMIMLLPALLPKFAIAGGDNSGINFTPPETDISIVLLGYIFGLVDGVLYGGGSQIVGEMFGMFNAAVIVLGSIVIMYSVILSIVNTSGEGQFLGKQWSSVWVPLRSVAGIALLIPKASGYCTIQIFVMWVVVQGVGAADAIWGQALTYLQRGGVLIDSPVSQAPANAADFIKNCGFYKNVGSDLPFKSALNNIENECRGYATQLFGSSTSTATTFDKKAAAADMLRSLICMHSLQRVLGKKRAELSVVGNTEVDLVPQYSNFLTTIGSDGKVKSEILIPPRVSNSTGVGSYDDYAGVCGKVEFTTISDAELAKVANKFKDIPGMYLGDGSINTNHPIISATQKSRAIAVQQMLQELSSVAFRIVNNVYYDNDAEETKYNHVLGYWHVSSGSNPFRDWVGNPQRTLYPMMSGYELVNAVNAYVALMRPSLRLLQDKMGDVDFIESARAQGWLMAGSFFFDIIKATEEAGAAAFQPNSVTADFTFNRDKLVSPSGPCTLTGNSACKVHYTQDGISKSSVLTLDDFNQSASPLGFCEYWSAPCGGSGDDLVEKYIANAMLSQETTEASVSSGVGFSTVLPDIPKRTGSMFNCGFFLFNILECVMYITDNFLIMPLANSIIGLINWIVIPVFSAVVFEPIMNASSMFAVSIKASYEPGNNPILEVAKFGNFLMNLCVNLLIGVIIWAIITVLIPIPLLSVPIFLIFGPMILVLIGSLWGTGLIMAYYAPLIPYIIFTMASIGWFVSVIEAMVAAPIVALGLAHPDGGQDEALGRAESSVMILANIFLRPSLMVLGFIIGMIFCYVVVILFNAGFVRVNEMVLDIATGGFGAFLAPIFMITFYVTFYMNLIEKCFELIHILPDQVLTWIGGQREEVGDRFAQGTGAAMKQQIEKSDSEGKKIAGGAITGAKKGARIGVAAASGGASETSGAGGKIDDATSIGEG